MKMITVQLDAILKAREERSIKRKHIADQNLASLSFNLNIPGYPKSDQNIKNAFNAIKQELNNFLLAHRVIIDSTKEFYQTDEAGDFYLIPLPISTNVNQLKQLTEKFESTHFLGRLIDVDITDQNFNPISSGKKKLCFYCEQKPAIVCMREKNHTYEEIREKIQIQIKQYLNKNSAELIRNKITSFALKSILYEISLTPKPGLVDFNNAGVHKDMNYYTFVNSTSVILPYFTHLVDEALDFKENIANALPQIRRIGIVAEKKMFAETQGVNTQKGVVFLLGLSVFISSYIIKHLGYFSSNMFREILKKMCGSLVIEELQSNEKSTTNGEKCFAKFGNKYGGGARAEAENGFPMVFNFAKLELDSFDLKYYQTDSIKELNKALMQALLSIMANNNDSNILYRSNIEVLEKFKKMSDEALIELKGENKLGEKYNELNNYCLRNRISPGGAADLLSVCVFVKMCEQFFKKAN